MITPLTTKGKIFFFIPLGLIGILLIYSWIVFLTSPNVAVLTHYLGLLLFLPIIYFLYKDKTFKKAIVLTGVYLILGTINLLSFLPFIMTSSWGITIGSLNIWTPRLNGFALVLLLIYSILNFTNLVDIYHDYKETNGTL